MGTLSLDTLKLARKLQAGGFTPQQAEAAAAAIAESLAEVAESLPTRSDLKGEITDVRRDVKEAELRLEAEIAGVRQDVKGIELGLKAEVAEAGLRLQTRIAESKAEILKWMYGAMAAQTALIVGLLKLLP
jgi:hypothetical protein